jgi:hypothetical protein
MARLEPIELADAGDRRMNTPYLAWAVAVGAAGCGRSAAAA